MARKQLLVGLYVIGLFLQTLNTTIIVAIHQNASAKGESFQDYYHNWQINTNISSILISALIIMILYWLTSLDPNPNFIKSGKSGFLIEISDYFIAFILGFLTPAIFILIVYNISGELAADNAYQKIISFFGLVESSNMSPWPNYDHQLKNLLVKFLYGISSFILIIVIIIASNMHHLNSNKQN